MKKSLFRCLAGLFAGFCLLVWTSCGGDDYHYPSVKLEFLTLTADEDGADWQAITDDGVTHNVSGGVDNLTPREAEDLRVIAYYEELPTENGVPPLKIYSAQTVVSPVPMTVDGFGGTPHTDPVEVQSIWMGYQYLNCMLGIKRQEGGHTLHFIENYVQTDEAAGTRQVDVTLYHDRGDDVPVYTSRVYVSMPLQQSAGQGIHTVYVTFHVHTEEDGVCTYEFTYIP